MRKVEQQLEGLAALRANPAEEETLAALRNGLGDRVNVVVAKAAQIAGELQLKQLIPDLLHAFDRLFRNAVKSDPQCWGKNAIAKALKNLDYDESTPFLRGIKHRQMEPVWGGQEDTAATLRGTSALALLQCRDLTREDKLWHVMRLLTDPVAPVRRDASISLQELAGREAALLLRLKARMGDPEPAVIGQVLESLLAIEGEEGVPFVAEFLGSQSEEVRGEAAVALGASRLASAIPLLKAAWKDARNTEERITVLRAIGASRQEPAIEFMLGIVHAERESEAIAALEALQSYRNSAEIRSRIATAVATRAERAVQEYFRTHFECGTA